jgi:molecular chaperone GrpE (heat shock protein)
MTTNNNSNNTHTDGVNMTKEDFINSLSNLNVKFLDSEGDMKWAAQQLREMAEEVEGWSESSEEGEE